jgi:hypothetical protein
MAITRAADQDRKSLAAIKILCGSGSNRHSGAERDSQRAHCRPRDFHRTVPASVSSETSNHYLASL